MMTEKRKNYTAEFKREAVRLVSEQGYSMSKAARSLDININMLRRWRHQLEEQEHHAFPVKAASCLNKRNGAVCVRKINACVWSETY
jgi:transposase-like protein